MRKTVILLTVFTLLLALGGCKKAPQETQPSSNGEPVSSGTGPVQTLPKDDPTTAPTTLPETQPTTLPTTEPATEPTTEPTTVPTTVPETEPPLSMGDLAAQTALAQVGKEYLYGGAGPDSFDTSGLVYYCFVSNGISVPRGTNAQSEFGTEVAKEELQPGDVVFFWTDTPGTAQFVGLYVGGNQFISASSTKGLVRSMDITSSYYTEHYVFARRFV